MIERTDAIILKTQNWSESSRIVSAFTKHYGRMKFMAKGARKPRSKFGASFESGGISQIVFYRSRHSELHTVSEAAVIWSPQSCNTETDFMNLISVALEIGYKATGLESPNLAFYNNLSSFARALPSAIKKDGCHHLLSFYLSALSNLGYYPRLDTCAKCGRSLPNGTAVFSVSDGGFLCRHCPSQESDCVPLKATQSSALCQWHKDNLLNEISSPDSRQLMEVLAALVNHHISGRMKLSCLKYLG
jgi:DNA repair protein RecO (recombination protein O)